MEQVWGFIAAVGAPMALSILAAVVFGMLPEDSKIWLGRRRGVLAAGFLLALATVAISIGVAILVTSDHFGAATPGDAYVMGPLLIFLGFAIAGFGVAAYRNHPVQ